MYAKTKRIIADLLEPDGEGTRASAWVGGFIALLVVLNLIAMILESVEALAAEHESFFFAFELASVALFTLEYLLRLWSCTERPAYRGPLLGRLRFVLTPLALIDLVAIGPFFLRMFFSVDLRVLRALRLFRLMRIMKLGRYSKAMQLMGQVIRANRAELSVVVVLLVVLLVVSSSLMYFVEHEAQPEDFSSIPATMWWGVVTLTTVGYGDVFPVTALGKVLAACMALFGIGMFALPAGILSTGFMEAMAHNEDGERRCPHCGERLE